MVEVGDKSVVKIDPRRCGLRNVTDESEARASELCHSQIGQGIGKSFEILIFANTAP